MRKIFRDMLRAVIMLLVFATPIFCIVDSLSFAYQSPVNYIDSVDAIQANIANQKYAEWITANDADIDTLETLNESVFSACDTTGGQTITKSDSAYVTLDKDILSADIYTHATDDYAVAINQAGMYLVFANVTVATPTAGPTDFSYGRIDIKKYSSSWLNVQGGAGGTYIGRTNSPSGQMVAFQIIPFVVGDSVAIQAKNVDPVVDFITVAEGVSLMIMKLY